MRRRIATTRITARPRASMETLVVLRARTVTRPFPQRAQPPVSVPRPTWFATAYASLWARAPPAKQPSRGAGSVLVLVWRRVTAGRPAACLEGDRGPGSASTPHAIWRAVSVLGTHGPNSFLKNIMISGGGCVLPLTPFSPIGQDCTNLPGVADVSCLSGECVIHHCMPGYTLSPEGTGCISAQAHNSRPHVSGPEGDEEYMQALRYGLEHLPFQRN